MQDFINECLPGLVGFFVLGFTSVIIFIIIYLGAKADLLFTQSKILKSKLNDKHNYLKYELDSLHRAYNELEATNKELYIENQELNTALKNERKSNERLI